MSLLNNLNQEQRKAVTATEGPVLVLAGAGSGKTRALTYRVAYLIREKKISPANILAVTFTNKAANEMAERAAKLLLIDDKLSNNQSIRLPWLGTFHSVSVRILRRDAHHLGLNRSFTIYDDQDQQALIKKILKQLSLDPKKNSPSSVAYFISGAKAELIGPIEYQKFATAGFQKIVAKVYELYEKELKRAEAMDFDDLLFNTVRLFRDCPEILEKYQNQFKYILIDEYQDTNQAQYVWAKLLSAKYRNICVVGDDFQSIYSWRGANYKNILNFEKDYPETKVIKMEQNYRSTKAILGGAQGVIEKNGSRSDKKIWTDNSEGLPITVCELPDDREEADFVAREIRALNVAGGDFFDFAVLYRTNAQSRLIEEVFIRYQIPYRIIGGVSFYQRREVKDILAYLRFVNNPGDLISLERIINLPTRGIGEKTFNKFLADFESAGWQIDKVLDLNPKISNFFSMIKRFRQIKKDQPMTELIDSVARISGLKEYLLDGTVEGEARFENIEELKNLAGNFLENRVDDSDGDQLTAFLERVALYQESEILNKEQQAVTLMTLHAAKGLEFANVFIIGLEEGIFPHSRSLSEIDQLEEERRLCYVGMTRAMKRLYLIYARQRMFHGNLSTSLPSRFISEIPEEFIDQI